MPLITYEEVGLDDTYKERAAGLSQRKKADIESCPSSTTFGLNPVESGGSHQR
jgi:hypothetical protein